MTVEDYVNERRSMFYPKTDEEPVNKLRHDIVVHEGLIYRHSRVANPDWGMRAEMHVADAAKKVGVPTIPMLVKFDEKSTYQVMRRARGTSLGEMYQPKIIKGIEGEEYTLGIDRDVSFYAMLGETLKKLHSIKTEGFGPIHPEGDGLQGIHDSWQDYIVTRLSEHLLHLLDEELISSSDSWEIKEHLATFDGEQFDCQPSLLHGDLNDHNIFVKDGEISDIIDWEDALSGDPIYDLAFWATFHPQELHPVLLDAYYVGKERPEGFHWRFWIYYLRVSISKLVQLHKYGFTDLTLGKARIQLALDHLW